MNKQKKPRIVEIKIKQLTPRGNGLGIYQHPQGMQWSLEVPFTLPDDHVRVQILKKNKGIYQCKLEELLEPSPKRITPKCIHFAHCGGCRWQHLPYKEQLLNKELFIKDCFKDLMTQTVIVHPISPCEDIWEYRNKMEFSFSTNRAGDRFLGLMIDSTRGKVFNLTECHLVHRWFAQAVKAVREWWEISGLDAYHAHNNTGTLRTLILREGMRTGERLAMLTVSGNPEYAISKIQLKSFTATLLQAAQPPGGPERLSLFLRIQQIGAGRPTEFYEMQLEGPDVIQEQLFIKRWSRNSLDTLKFNISPSAFFQPNTSQAENIYSLVLRLAKISSQDIVYDLYCGTGTLGISIASHAKEVIGVEISRESAHDAKANIKLNEISNMRIITGAVGEVLNKIYQEKEIPPPTIAVVDPPRAGLDPQTIRLLLTLKPKTIVYVSCNPASQANNIAELVKGDYLLECLQPVDQFPQTIHVENIAVLSKT